MFAQIDGDVVQDPSLISLLFRSGSTCQLVFEVVNADSSSASAAAFWLVFRSCAQAVDCLPEMPHAPFPNV